MIRCLMSDYVCNAVANATSVARLKRIRADRSSSAEGNGDSRSHRDAGEYLNQDKYESYLVRVSKSR